uniref:Uncharacterized protein n=1 Tax=mine drainage metagenome TaxID=410659 RepID=E6PP94_9ZZZZ
MSFTANRVRRKNFCVQHVLLPARSAYVITESLPEFDTNRAMSLISIDHAGSGGVREDGHDRGDQRAAGTQGRAGGAGDDAGFSRRLAHRLPEPAALVRPPHRAARVAL